MFVGLLLGDNTHTLIPFRGLMSQPLPDVILLKQQVILLVVKKLVSDY